jgi:tRNA-dihydrouridine synthase A
VVYDLRERIKPVPVVLNGGLRTVEHVAKHLAWADGVMLGREAYHRPMLLAELSSSHAPRTSRPQMLERMAGYARREIARGERLSSITRHMLGLYAGQPGAKEFRRRISEGARSPEASPDLLLESGEVCERLNEAVA